MKIKLLIVYAGLIIAGTSSSFAFSNDVLKEREQGVKKSKVNSSNPDELGKVSITNEAEYAEFQKQRELANRTSSSSSSIPNRVSSHSNKSNATAK